MFINFWSIILWARHPNGILSSVFNSVNKRGWTWEVEQYVKVGSSISKWEENYKGVPQVSILEPVVFHILLNDIFNFIADSSLYNYADDNSVSCAGYDLDKLILTLENDNLTLIGWFTANQVKAIKPDKFQVLAIGKWTQIYLKLKFIYNDYSSTYDDLVEKFKLPSLKIRRTGTIAIETFKIIIKQSPV